MTGMLWTQKLTIVVLVCVSFLSLEVASDDGMRPADEPSECMCKFPKHHQPDPELLNDIRPLCGKRFSAEDAQRDGFEYTVGICVPALRDISDTADVKLKTAGAIQVQKKTPGSVFDSRTHVIGDIEKTEIMSGNNWILLEYEGGENFHTHCSSEGKRTIIMISCKSGETEGKFRWVEENNNKTGDCYYLFEMDHQAACTPLPSGLSTGSVVCIIIFCFVAVYLIGGVLYMRLVRKAKSLNQIPNYSFWRDFGALQADGCDLVCRCGSKPYDSSMNYHGIGDHQIECPNDNDEYDERLLPM